MQTDEVNVIWDIKAVYYGSYWGVEDIKIQ